ncbi:MAG: AI-2E family transporter, partial [Bacteriovoracaceae bacterium]
TLMAAAFVLAITKTVMIPFVLSVFLYLILTPIMKGLQTKLKMKRWAALALTLFLFLSGIILITWLISGSIDSFIQGIDQYKDRVQNVTEALEVKFKKLGFDFDGVGLGGDTVLPTLRKITTSMIGLLSNSVLVIIFTLFLITGENVTSRNETVLKIKNSIARYVSTKLLVSLATGALSYVIFLIFDIELASMFAVLTVLLNFIPTIGSIFAVLLPLPVVLLQYFFGWQFFAVLGLLGIFQFLIGNILEPKIMGKSMGLHPVAILLSLTFWGFIWGIPGMFLSVPIMAALKIVFESFSFTAPLGALMEGRLAG